MPSDQPLPSNLDVAACVRKLWQDEAWVDHAASLHLKLTDHSIATPAGQAAQIADLKEKFPNAVIDEKAFPHLKPETHGTIEWAFDARRLFKRVESDSFRLLDLRIWNGQKGLCHELYHSGQEHYAFLNDIERLFFSGAIPWPRRGPHQSWWHKFHEDYSSPVDYRLTARVIFRGRDCLVLEHDNHPWLTLYVGTDDQRLHGYIQWVTNNSRQIDREYDQASAAVAAEFGQKIDCLKSLEQWAQTLPRDDRAAVDRLVAIRMKKFAVPQFTFWYEDYRPIADGCWMPMFMGSNQWNTDLEPYEIRGERQLTVVSAVKDQPLPDAIFEMPMRDGVKVNDWTHDPPLFYKQKHDMTDEEWKAILAEADERKRAELERQAAKDSVTGKPVPPFPQTQWINSPPLTWEQLNGKFVILDFWSERCGPCMQFMPLSQKIHENRDTTGVCIIGVHPRHSELSAIMKVVERFNLTYPILIDARAPEGGHGWGLLYGQYQIHGIPDSVLVDPAGRIVAHGRLESLVQKARWAKR